MTVLSSQQVLTLINQRKLYLSPILDPDEQIGPVSIDLRLGHVALFARASGLSHVDPRNYESSPEQDQVRERRQRQKFSRSEFTFADPLLLHPGSLTLVPTLEWIQLPNNVKGVVTARSSWAREGLSIATANFINPGYNGIITLELANLGHIPIQLYPGMRIAQIAFYKVDKPNKRVKGSQFDLSFEPKGGEIARYDEPFLPIPTPKATTSKQAAPSPTDATPPSPSPTYPARST
jgi:dCTP deaminase